MYRFLLMLLFVSNSVAFAQKTKNFTVYAGMTGSIERYIHYDSSGTLIDTTYSLYARDARYQALSSYFTVAGGVSIIYVKDLLLKSKDILKTEEAGTTVQYKGYTIGAAHCSLTKCAEIWASDNSGAYTVFETIRINNFLTGIENYMKSKRYAK